MNVLSRWLIVPSIAVAAIAVAALSGCGSSSAPASPSSPSAAVAAVQAGSPGGSQGANAGGYQGGGQNGNQGACQGDCQGNCQGSNCQGDCQGGSCQGDCQGSNCQGACQGSNCQGDCQGDCQDGTQGGVSVEVLSAALQATLQDEYHAANVYQRVLNDFGAAVLPFATIVTAERTHAASIATLLTNRSWAVPASQWTTANVPAFASVQAACAAGVAAEQDNIELYDQYLALPLPADVLRVFQNHRRASLENHLPAFERCR